MFSFSAFPKRSWAFALFLIGSAPVCAESTVLSGVFNGDESSMIYLDSAASCKEQAAYQQTTFQVSRDGSYVLDNALDNLYGYGAVGVSTRLYKGSFNPASPGENYMIPRIDYPSMFTFKAGKTYVLFLQQWCHAQKGPWAIWFRGPGSVSSVSTASVPGFTSGTFSESDPKIASDCSGGKKTAYHQSGPIQVARDGSYYFSDSSIRWSIFVCLQIFTAPFDPADPVANRVGFMRYGQNRIDLKAGQNYYLVTQSVGGQEYGEFVIALAPPAPFRINSGLAGSWYNPDTPGQGFFLSVYEKANRAFLGWFTYAPDPPADDEFAHRWITAAGPIVGETAGLVIDWTAGGAFDAAEPAPEHFQDGTIELEFHDCRSGQIRYDWDGDGVGRPGASGVIPIRRITNDSLALCESLNHRPGMLGPL
jgi:hypothetical protein